MLVIDPAEKCSLKLLCADGEARLVRRLERETAPQIAASFLDSIALLDAHLAKRPYLFEARPSFEDFELSAQL